MKKIPNRVKIGAKYIRHVHVTAHVVILREKMAHKSQNMLTASPDNGS